MTNVKNQLPENLLTDSARKHKQELAEHIYERAVAVEACATVLDEMLGERPTADGPKWCRNDFLASGIVVAIKHLALQTQNDAGEVAKD